MQPNQEFGNISVPSSLSIWDRGLAWEGRHEVSQYQQVHLLLYLLAVVGLIIPLTSSQLPPPLTRSLRACHLHLSLSVFGEGLLAVVHLL